jgi:hypothetical protein
MNSAKKTRVTNISKSDEMHVGVTLIQFFYFCQNLMLVVVPVLCWKISHLSCF